jgi:von Hippel-Lindau disease tumor supressor
MLHVGQIRIGTMVLVGAAAAALLSAAPARAQAPLSLDCGLAASVRSLPSTTPATIEFVNQTMSPIVVSWIDFQGQPQVFLTLQGGESRVQQTFLKHVWKVAALNQTCLGVYVATSKEAKVTIVPDLLQSLGCGRMPSLRSIEGKTPTTIEFVNQSAIVLAVYWIDYQGLAKQYTVLQPGQAVVQQTFVTHPWLVTTTDGVCLGVYQPTRRPGQVLVAPKG